MKNLLIYFGIFICALTSCSKDYSFELPQPEQLSTELTRLPTDTTQGTSLGSEQDATGNTNSGQSGNTTQSTTNAVQHTNTTTEQNSGGSTAPTVSPYYMRFKADGVFTEYKKMVLAFKMNYEQEFSISVQGQNVVTNNPPGLSIIVTDKSPITTKTYFELNNMSISTMQYRNDGGIDFSTGFVEPSSGLKTVITELASTGVKGTFSGKVADLNSNKVHTITEGEFYAKF